MPNGYIDKASLGALRKGERWDEKKKRREERERERGRSAKFDPPPRSLSLLWPLFFRICSARGLAHLRLVACCSCEKRTWRKREWIQTGINGIYSNGLRARVFPATAVADAVAADRRVTEIVSREPVSTCTFGGYPGNDFTAQVTRNIGTTTTTR